MNFGLRLDEILELLHNSWLDDDYEAKDPDATEAKAAITSLIKELVAEAKPAYKTDTRGATQNPNNAFYHTKKAQGYNEAIEDYEQNILKALEEV